MMENKIDGLIMIAWACVFAFQMHRLGHPKIETLRDVVLGIFMIVSIGHGFALLFR